jgi:hypothetical protein
MREWLMVMVGVVMISTVFTYEAVGNENNNMIKACLYMNGYTPEKFDTFEWNKASSCYQNYKVQANAEKLAELRDFLKHNPRYRYPGQSNNKCFGKPREMPFETAYIERNGDGFKAEVTYKDKLPSGCFETTPWDNRNK